MNAISLYVDWWRFSLRIYCPRFKRNTQIRDMMRELSMKGWL